MRWSGLVFWMWAATGCLATCGAPIEAYEHPTSALLLMDLQRDFLDDNGRMAVERGQVDALLNSVTALHAQAVALDRPVFRVENVYAPWDPGNLFRNGAAVRGEPGAAWDPRVPGGGEGPFPKDQPDAFSNQDFDAALRRHQVSHLVITGVYADGCVLYTARGALNRRYHVTVVALGVAAGTDEARDKALERLRRDGVDVVERVEDVRW